MPIEREAKFLVDAEFELPAFPDAVDHGLKVLDATYYDTPDLQLASKGMTFRFRNGKWTLKQPEASDSTHLSRDEIEVEAPPDAVPDELLARLDMDGLVPVARLRSTRRRLMFAGDVELADDSVEVLDGDRVLARFREIEVELVGDDESQLHGVVGVLQAAGVGEHDPTPKLIRALTLLGRYRSPG